MRISLIPHVTPYQAAFKIDKPLDRTKDYPYFEWYDRSSKVTFKRCVAVIHLNQLVAQGAFCQPGTYVFQMVSQKGFKVHRELYLLGEKDPCPRCDDEPENVT